MAVTRCNYGLFVQPNLARLSPMYCSGCGQIISADEMIACSHCGKPVGLIPSHFTPEIQSAEYRDFVSKKVAAGVCGILLGSIGVHKFILGRTLAGVIMLLATVLTCGFAGVVMHTIGIIEGIIYLTKSDREFYQIYGVEQKSWF
jgi:TM2 domain-containing membrane protein YozV